MNPPIASSQLSDFDSWLSDVRSLVDSHVGRAVQYYDNHTRHPWLFFRISGSLAIVLSISLPVLSSLKPDVLPAKDLVVSLVALAVAILSALGTFFHWHETWRENTRAKLELRELLAVWELKLLSAQQHETPNAKIQAVVAATETLLADARKVGTSNTEGYFKNVRIPDVKR